MRKAQPVNKSKYLIASGDTILITGSSGFIGSRVVDVLLREGFTNLRCLVRPSSELAALHTVLAKYPMARVEVLRGNLLSPEDCAAAAKDAALIFHLAAGNEKSFAGCFRNCVLTTRNLLEAAVHFGRVRRFVNTSSFTVYSNWNLVSGALLDESCPLEDEPVQRGEAYTFAKLYQDQVVVEYSLRYDLPFVIMRPGVVYGPGGHHITPRVGIDTFGIFFHLGGANQLPLTYVDNCAEAMVLGGLEPGVDGEVFNIVDDDLPTSREFLKKYKREGKRFRSIYIPYWCFYRLCSLWERYSQWSRGQLPPVFTRRRCATYWKGNKYTNRKLKDRLGWQPRVSFSEARRKYFEDIRKAS